MNNDLNLKNVFICGVKDGIPIGLGYFAVSFAFGMTAATGGMSAFDAGLISLTNLTSAGQFAALGIIASNGSYFELFLSQLVINLRYMLMSFSLSQKIDPKAPFFHRFIASFGITDEIFGISSAQEYPLHPVYIYGAMSVAIPGWVAGTLAGALLKDMLPGMILSALGIAIYGMFLAIIIPPASEQRAVGFAVFAAMALASAFHFIPGLNRVSAGFVIIIVTVVTSAAAALLAPVEDDDEG